MDSYGNKINDYGDKPSNSLHDASKRYLRGERVAVVDDRVAVVPVPAVQFDAPAAC